MKRSRIIAALITVAWLASMAALIHRHYGQYEAASPGGGPPAWLLEENWMGIYRDAAKVGYSMTKLDPEEGGYRATERSYIKLTMMGVQKEMETSTDALMDEGMRLRSFSFGLDSDVSIKVEGEVRGKEMVMTLNMGGVKTEKTIRLPEAPYMSPDLSVVLKDPEPGKKLRFPVMSPSSMAGDYMEVEVLGPENITVMGIPQDTYKLRGAFMGAEITMWAKPDGEILKQEAMGFTYLKESELEAKSIGDASPDIVDSIAIPAGADIPEGVRRLKVRLTGIDAGRFELDGGVQKLSEGNVLSIEIPATVKSAEAPSEMDEYLKASFLIESDDPAVVSLAKEIVADEKDPVRKARLLSEWVFKNLKKSPTVTMPSALEVLQSRRGDCNEHTALYTALARAAGVPSRVAVGIVHNEGYFLYHAWPEIYMGGWIPVDPTFGQFPADATHIRLLTGGIEKQMQIGPAIGKLKIEVVEYR